MCMFRYALEMGISNRVFVYLYICMKKINTYNVIKMTVKIHNLYLGIKRVGLGLMILAMLQGPCVWGMTFSVYAMESFSNLQYQIGSEDVLSGSYPPREGLGIALKIGRAHV